MRRLRQQIRQVGPTPLAVLIRGETGTGKELVAEAIHACSVRAPNRLLKCNCAAFAPGVLATELFGHVKGAFTGATRDNAGRFAKADGGTLFLDEIGDLSADTQISLLRVLQDGEFEPVGTTQTRRADVRIITATHQNLERQRAAGRFREDLFHRISSLVIGIPALRDRREDLPLLCQHIIGRDRQMLGTQTEKVDEDAMEALCAYDWPGNVRELENVLRGAMVTAPRNVLRASDLRFSGAGQEAAPACQDRQEPWSCTFSSALFHTCRRELDRALIRRVLARTGGNISQAAKHMQLGRRSLQRKITEYGIDVAQVGGAFP